MSNMSLLFLVVTLIAAMFSFGLIDSEIADPARLVFAVAIVLFLATLAIDGSHRNATQQQHRDGSAGREQNRGQRPRAGTGGSFERPDSKGKQAGAAKRAAKKQNTYSDVV